MVSRVPENFSCGAGGAAVPAASCASSGRIFACPHYDLVPKDLDANIAYRYEMLKLAGNDSCAAAQIWTMCKEDPLFYVNTFCWTYAPKLHARTPVVPFVTYEFQDDAMLQIARCVESGEDFAVPKSRDMGASWMGLTIFEWFWHFQHMQSFLLISRNEDYVDKRGNPKSLFWKIDFLHEHQPRWLLPTGRSLGWKDPNRRLLHLENADTGSVIDGESTTGDAGRGDRRTAMLIDEHAAFELNDGFRVLKASRDTTDCRGFNSTPQGANNAFYEVCHNTSARIIRLHWSDHPEKRRGLYTTGDNGKVKLLDDYQGLARVRAKGDSGAHTVMFPDDYSFILDGKLRSPWYDRECARCASPAEISQELDIDFLGSDFQFFDPEFIDILRKKYCRAPMMVGNIEFDSETLQFKRFIEDPRGIVALWITLDGEGRPARDRKFVVGSDVSAGTGASNSVTSIVDDRTGEKIGVIRTPFLRPTAFARLSIAVARWMNGAMMIWDASGATGKIFTQQVIASRYASIYYRRSEKKVTRKISEEPGYYMNPQDREALLEDYRAALADQQFINRSETGMTECLQFIRKPDGTIEHSAAANAQDPSGARTAHGDEVIADALASKVRQDICCTIEAEKPDIPPGSLAWRRQQRAMAEAHLNAVHLGVGW